MFWNTFLTCNNPDITNLGFILLPNHNVINCTFHRTGGSRHPENHKNRDISAAVWPIFTKFGTLLHLLDPLKHGYHRDDHGDILPTTTNVPPAPQAILEPIRCQCKAHCTTQRCSCKRHDLHTALFMWNWPVKITWIVTLNTTVRTVMKIYRKIPVKTIDLVDPILCFINLCWYFLMILSTILISPLDFLAQKT